MRYYLCSLRYAFSFRIPHSDFRIRLLLVFIDVNIALVHRDIENGKWETIYYSG